MSKRKRDWSMSSNGPMQIENLHDQANGINEGAASLPSISRKITACTACRKQKACRIKCDMPNENPPCTRCSRRGIPCVLNKSLQALLDDQKQTELLQYDVHNIYGVVKRLCQQLGAEPPQPLASAASQNLPGENGQGVHSDTDKDRDDACELSPPTSPSAVQAPIDTFLDITKPSPSSVDTPQTFRQRRPTQQQDLITKGIITSEVAERLVEGYFSRLDHFLYGIGSRYQDMQSLRLTSPVLFAAICTVSALHDHNDQTLYEVCNREYRRLVSRSLFEKRDIEYLRALCIGSFWLADASRILSSDAIRRAADLRLHRSFYHIVGNATDFSTSDTPLTHAESRDRARLWYLLFVCDQHLSILHNRDPLLRHEKDILVNWETYLESAGSTDSDVRITSQVGLLLIMSQVRDALGSERPEQVSRTLAGQFNHFSRQLDKWFAKFSALFKPNPRIGDFPRKGLEMHYQFGKLYLGHHIFRGLKAEPIPPQFTSAASLAHDAAVAIFEMILNDEQLRESLVGMPHYFHIMIAFAGHFLLDVCTKFSEQLMLDLDRNFDLIGKVLTLFGNIPSIPQHPLNRMTAGLMRKLVDSATTMGKALSLAQNYAPSSFYPNQVDSGAPAAMLQNTHMTPGTPFDMMLGQLPVPTDDFVFTDFGGFNLAT